MRNPWFEVAKLIQVHYRAALNKATPPQKSGPPGKPATMDWNSKLAKAFSYSNSPRLGRGLPTHRPFK